MPDCTAQDALLAEIRRLRDQVRVLQRRAERAEALADHDVLTPALNRRGFMKMITRIQSYCRRHGVEAVLIYLDMDGFKQINDRFGHAAGDAALIQVAEILLESVRESDAVGRLGGDEFALLMVNAGPAEAHVKAQQLMDRLATRPYVWEGHAIPLRVSFGLKALDGQPDAEQWLAQADAAMWLRKRDNG